MTVRSGFLNRKGGHTNPIEILTAAKSLGFEDSGKTFFLNLAGGFTVTLPSIAEAGEGWNCKFQVKTSPTTAYIITEKTAADTNVIISEVNELETDTNTDGPYSNAHTTITLVANLAVVGDFVRIECDGTKYYADCQANVDGGIALA